MKKFFKILNILLLIGLISSASIITFFYLTLNESQQIWKIDSKNNIKYQDTKYEPVAFSKDNKNILFLGFDAFSNSEIDKNKAIWKSKNTFDNFTRYKKTYSVSSSTLIGFFGLIGGWMSNPIAFSDKKFNYFNKNEKFDNINNRARRFDETTYSEYTFNHWTNFINSVKKDNYDLKLSFSNEYYKQGYEKLGEYRNMMKKMRNDFSKDQVETITYNYGNYWSKYKIDDESIESYNVNINDIEYMYKNYKTYNGKGKFNFTYSESLHAPYYKETNGKFSYTDDNWKSLEYQLKHIHLLFEKMKHDKVWDNTLIIISSDHGIMESRESVMMVKPWNTNSKYSENNDLIIGNSDFPMILKNYMKDDFDSSYYERAKNIPLSNKYKEDFFVYDPLNPLINKRKKIINYALFNSIIGDSKMLNLNTKYGIANQLNINPLISQGVTSLDSVLLFEVDPEAKKIYKSVESKDVFPGINPFNNGDGDIVNNLLKKYL